MPNLLDTGARPPRDPQAVNSPVHFADAPPASDSRPAASRGSPPSPSSPGASSNVAAIAGPGASPETVSPPTVSQTGLAQAGQGGEAGIVPRITNAEFEAAVFDKVPEGASAAVCSKRGDPTIDVWVAQRAGEVDDQCPPDANNFSNCSSFYLGDDGSFKARKERFAACHVLLLDDLGTKISLERLGNFKPTWRIETSPGNFQVGIVLQEPITDPEAATELHRRIVAAGLCDPGASGPTARWARLPVGINGKPKYVDENGEPFRCRLVEWNSQVRYSPQEIMERLALEHAAVAGTNAVSLRKLDRKANITDQVYTPRATTNPVVAELKAQGLYKRDLGSGRHDITCPWVKDHTERLDDGAAYLEPDKDHPLGGFRCHHSHGDQYHIRHLLDHLGVSELDARHVASINVVRGEVDRVASSAEKVLADSGRYFQWGGLIASVVVDPATGLAAIVPASASDLTRALSSMAYWKQYDGRSSDYVRCDPPARHIAILCDTRLLKHLPPLAGIARQPYFRESDGVLIVSAGYDPVSHLLGVFDERDYSLPAPSREAAQAALAKLQGLLREFAFAEPTDMAAAIAAILTATVRPSLPHAPAFHISAPASGSGKSYLSQLIGLFAGPAGAARMSYPIRAEEATKAVLAALLSAPPVLEFDDMVHDWIAHGVINRMLTSEYIDERVLGFSKIARVSTRTLVLGSGNNVGPVQDLMRRVLPIRLDRRSAAPATTQYSGTPVEEVRSSRSKYVALALTIMAAWREAGCPRTDVKAIATYGGAWADFCRHPLIWLGLPDPAASLLDQIRHDPDDEALGQLLRAWYHAFASMPTTVRKVLHDAESHESLREALEDLPIVERDGSINRSKLGQFLKRNANRVVDGYMFQKCTADGRTAWRVVKVAPAQE